MIRSWVAASWGLTPLGELEAPNPYQNGSDYRKWGVFPILFYVDLYRGFGKKGVFLVTGAILVRHAAGSSISSERVRENLEPAASSSFGAS